MQNANPGRDRGSVLFTVLIVVLAITLLGTAIIVGSGRHLTSARIHETDEGLINCAMSVRQYIAANITGGLPDGGPAGLPSLNFTVPSTGAAITIKGGHYENADGGYALGAAPSFGAKTGSSVQNIANAMPMILGSNVTQQTGSAVCNFPVDPSDPNSAVRTYEVEFSYVGQ
jgi:hypothetical protein